MRSRYSAFCTGNFDYLVATHSLEDAVSSDHKSLKKTLKTTRWLNLLIIKTEKGKPKDLKGIVEFVAAYEPIGSVLSVNQAGGIEQLHERSHFIQRQGRWLYTDGDPLPPYRPKRSALCWCGSGKPFKQCHGQA